MKYGKHWLITGSNPIKVIFFIQIVAPWRNTAEWLWKTHLVVQKTTKGLTPPKGCCTRYLRLETWCECKAENKLRERGIFNNNQLRRVVLRDLFDASLKQLLERRGWLWGAQKLIVTLLPFCEMRWREKERVRFWKDYHAIVLISSLHT
jgi:hypothetical protein